MGTFHPFKPLSIQQMFTILSLGLWEGIKETRSSHFGVLWSSEGVESTEEKVLGTVKSTSAKVMECKLNVQGLTVRSRGVTVCTCSVALSCLTLCNPVDRSPPGSSVHGILLARILEWVAISYSRRFSLPRGWTCLSWISCIDRQILYHCTTWEALQESLKWA